jgi:hypothetical protein
VLKLLLPGSKSFSTYCCRRYLGGGLIINDVVLRAAVSDRF